MSNIWYVMPMGQRDSYYKVVCERRTTAVAAVEDEIGIDPDLVVTRTLPPKAERLMTLASKNKERSHTLGDVSTWGLGVPVIQPKRDSRS